MLKKELRKLYGDMRSQMRQELMEEKISQMILHFREINFKNANCCMSFWPVLSKKEISVNLFEAQLSQKQTNITFCYPKADFQTFKMEAYAANAELEWEEALHGIMQPKHGNIVPPALIDCILVPLLAFDKQGNRVGYGKGFYDRYFARCRQDVIKVGFCLFEAVPLIDDANNYDVPLTYCVTPQQLYVF